MDFEEILHHQKDAWNPINNGMFTIYQLVIRILLAHPPYDRLVRALNAAKREVHGDMTSVHLRKKAGTLW